MPHYVHGFVITVIIICINDMQIFKKLTKIYIMKKLFAFV